jgi:plasmid maintenance system antidote protein VapI
MALVSHTVSQQYNAYVTALSELLAVLEQLERNWTSLERQIRRRRKAQRLEGYQVLRWHWAQFGPSLWTEKDLLDPTPVSQNTAAAMIGVSQGTISRLVSSGKLPTSLTAGAVREFGMTAKENGYGLSQEESMAYNAVKARKQLSEIRSGRATYGA